MNDISVNKFKGLLDSRTPSVMLMYAPWCGACKNFKPLYQDFVKNYSSIQTGGGKLFFGQMDADKHSKELEQIKVGNFSIDNSVIKYFPTILLFAANGSMAKYEGPRESSVMKEQFEYFFEEHRE